jgi:hypothetical protein
MILANRIPAFKSRSRATADIDARQIITLAEVVVSDVDSGLMSPVHPLHHIAVVAASGRAHARERRERSLAPRLYLPFSEMLALPGGGGCA